MLGPIVFFLLTYAIVTTTLGYHLHFRDGETEARRCGVMLKRKSQVPNGVSRERKKKTQKKP